MLGGSPRTCVAIRIFSYIILGQRDPLSSGQHYAGHWSVCHRTDDQLVRMLCENTLYDVEVMKAKLELMSSIERGEEIIVK